MDNKEPWETEGFFREMERKDAKDFMNRHIRWLKANGYTKTFIDSRLLQLNMCSGSTVEGIIERNELL